MNPSFAALLSRYPRKTRQEHEHALKEILQEIALLGLWRAKFFEHAAFYGGTALRIHHGLNRFSEDLEFSLLEANRSIQLVPFFDAIRLELAGFGFTAEVSERQKASPSPIAAGMVKLGLRESFLEIEVPPSIVDRIPVTELIKIRVEVDTDPPGHFDTEAQTLLAPIPFYVRTFTLPCLFAGKLHAILCRSWDSRVKGRDWYDLVWYVGRSVPVSLRHLAERLGHSGDLDEVESFDRGELRRRLQEVIESLDVESAKRDVLPFLADPASTDLWSRDFFTGVAARIQSE